jgi:peptidoglycan/xylan/chitin deacetylase (PgdA/CDA1 family)
MILRLTKLIFSVTVRVYDQILRCSAKLARKALPGTCSVLYYHAVRPGDREKFARQLDEILRYAKPVRADARLALNRGTHHVAVTFDDGFVSVLENAVPELLARNIPFTMFVPTGYLGKHPGWIEDRARAEYQETVINDAELRALAKVETAAIGSHGMSHSDLRLVDRDTAEAEIQQSKSDLERIVGRRVNLLSFPHGGYTERCLEFAHLAGYERVFTIQPTLGLMHPLEFVTGRISVSPGDWTLEFRLKMLGAYRWLPRAYSLKRRIRSLWN